MSAAAGEEAGWSAFDTAYFSQSTGSSLCPAPLHRHSQEPEKTHRAEGFFIICKIFKANLAQLMHASYVARLVDILRPEPGTDVLVKCGCGIAMWVRQLGRMCFQHMVPDSACRLLIWRCNNSLHSHGDLVLQ